MPTLFALADCNNFFVSCERIFNPVLREQPTIVLSNNDGCVIARSNEAKVLGIDMGVPLFKCRDIVMRHHIHVYSANFVLYGDISARIMHTLKQYTPNLEVYSIDEAFLQLDGQNEDPTQFIQSIRTHVKRDIGMPISIGVSTTKTLAKIANRIAKKHCIDGVFCLIKPQDIHHWLTRTDVGDVWGIGQEKTLFLKRHGIENALQLSCMPDEWIKKHLTIISLKTVFELRGISCLPLEEALPDKKAIGTSRTFGHNVKSLEEISEAISAYVAKASEKLRKQNSVCGHIQVFLETDRFKEGKYYSNSAAIDITPPTAYTPDLIARAKRLVERLYRPGYSYKKAGVLLTHLQSQNHEQHFIFDQTYKDSAKERLMNVVDQFNRQTNHGRIFIASEGIHQPWYMKQAHKSKRFTTRWDELLEVRA